MARIKKERAKGSFYLKPTTNKKGEQPIYLRFFVSGKYAKRSTDIWVKPDDWDQKEEYVKAKHKMAIRYNAKLDSLKQNVKSQILSYDGILTFEVVQKMMDGELEPNKAKDILFIDYCNKYNETQYSSSEYGYSVYYNSQKYIKKFEKYLSRTNQANLALSKITLGIIQDYRSELLKTLKRTSTNKALAPLIKAVENAKDNGLISADVSLPIKEKGYVSLTERTYNPKSNEGNEVHSLNEEQFKNFLDYEPSSNSAKRTKEFKQIFLFSYYACGLRISDIVTLEWSQIDFEKNTIDKIQVKTKEKGKISPRITDKGMAILNEWKEKDLNERFVFNFLPADFRFADEDKDDKDTIKKCDEALRKAINCADRTINQSLNHIGKQIGLPFSLTMHVARHTFCVNALSYGLSLHFVSQIMGHSSILATEKTYSNYLENTIENQFDKMQAFYNNEASAD